MTRQQRLKRSVGNGTSHAMKKSTKKLTTLSEDELDNSFGLRQLQRRLDEMKKTQAKSASYVDKFTEDVMRQQSEAVARLRAQHAELSTTELANNFFLLIRTSISGNAKSDATLLVIRDEIAKISGIEDHPLYRTQLDIFRSAENLLDLHTPLKDIIGAALNDTMNIGQDWDENGVDAVNVLDLLRGEAEKTVEKLISADTEGDKDNPCWGQVVKMTSKNIRKTLRHVPPLSEEEDKLCDQSNSRYS